MRRFKLIRSIRGVFLAATLLTGGALLGAISPAKAQANPYCYYPYYSPYYCGDYPAYYGYYGYPYSPYYGYPGFGSRFFGFNRFDRFHHASFAAVSAEDLAGFAAALAGFAVAFAAVFATRLAGVEPRRAHGGFDGGGVLT